MLDERGAGFALGAADYLVKPVDRDAAARRAGALRVAAGATGARVVAIDDDPRRSRPRRGGARAARAGRVRPRDGRRGGRASSSRRERPAVVLLDLLMPDVDGFEVVERLRADPLVADVPIVVLTSKDMTPRRPRAARRARSATSRRRARSARPSSSTLVGRVARAGERSRTRRHDRAGALILIVEDNARNLKLVRDVLNHVGYRDPRGRRRRGRARARPRASVPASILMDIQLPGHGRRRGARPPARRPRDRRHPASSR